MFSLSITPISPKSKGQIYENDSKCIVDPKYLSSKQDIDLLKLALKFCLKLLRSKPLDTHILEIEQEKKIEDKPDEYIINNIYSGHHLIGGMNNSINSNFELNGVEGLYICDASIFDKYAASNIHSSVVLISDLFSKKFIQRNKGDI